MVASKTCVVHIGAPKTGSTLIQRVLFENRETMRAHGMLYPDVSLRGYGHHDLAFLVAGGYPDWATPQARTLSELALDLAAACAAHSGSVVLSSEDFYLCPNPEGLRALLHETGVLNGRSPRIVVYLRRQDDAHESWYNQTIKAQGATHTPEACIERYFELWDYHRNLQRWEEVFGRDAIVARSYEEEELVGGSLLEDFFCTVGIDGSSFVISRERVNTGLNRDLLEFQRAFNQLPLTVQEKRAFHHQLIELTATTAGRGFFDEGPSIDSRTAVALMARYAEGNRAVAERYFGRSRLFAERNREERIEPRGAALDAAKVGAILAWLLLQQRG